MNIRSVLIIIGLLLLLLINVLLVIKPEQQNFTENIIVLDSLKPDYFYKLEPTTQTILECITTCERK